MEDWLIFEDLMGFGAYPQYPGYRFHKPEQILQIGANSTNRSKFYKPK